MFFSSVSQYEILQENENPEDPSSCIKVRAETWDEKYLLDYQMLHL